MKLILLNVLVSLEQFRDVFKNEADGLLEIVSQKGTYVKRLT